MTATTIAEAKNNLPKLIHAAEAGGGIHISRHGQPVNITMSASFQTPLDIPDIKTLSMNNSTRNVINENVNEHHS